MKKRLVSLLAVMTMLLSFMPVIARAATSGTCGDNLTWTIDNEGTQLFHLKYLDKMSQSPKVRF